MKIPDYQSLSRTTSIPHMSRIEWIIAPFAYAALIVYLVGVLAQWWPMDALVRVINGLREILVRSICWLLGVPSPAPSKTFLDQLEEGAR